MIRAEGYNTETGQKLQTAAAEPSRALNTFSIYRLEEGQEQSPELWTLLDDNLTSTSYTDADFSTTDPAGIAMLLLPFIPVTLPQQQHFQPY